MALINVVAFEQRGRANNNKKKIYVKFIYSNALQFIYNNSDRATIKNVFTKKANVSTNISQQLNKSYLTNNQTLF